MKIRKLIICLSFLATLCACKKDQLPDYVFNSPYDENSGIELFAIDTIYLSFDHQIVYLFFENDSILTHAISVADSLVVFRDGALHFQDLPKNHCADVGVSPQTSYTYNFAFRDSTGALTKLSQPVQVDIP